MYAVVLCIFVFSILNFVFSIPPEQCFAKFRWEDCGRSPKPVMYYWHPGSRCEVGTWRGCLPNVNMFADEYECVATCIFGARAEPEDYHKPDETFTEGDYNYGDDNETTTDADYTNDTEVTTVSDLNNATTPSSNETTIDHNEDGKAKWGKFCQNDNKQINSSRRLYRRILRPILRKRIQDPNVDKIIIIVKQ